LSRDLLRVRLIYIGIERFLTLIYSTVTELEDESSVEDWNEILTILETIEESEFMVLSKEIEEFLYRADLMAIELI
jgi:hypothetical protein